MPFSSAYLEHEPARAEVDAMPGALVIEFGAPWCGHCQAAEPAVERALAAHPGVGHLRIEDGRGRRLGRSFGIKLWPTLLFLRDGQEAARLVRPTGAATIEQALSTIVHDAAD